MNKDLGLTIILVVLVLILAMQTAQLMALGSQIESGEITGAVVSSEPTQKSSSSSGSEPSLPSSLTNLPNMVGGC